MQPNEGNWEILELGNWEIELFEGRIAFAN